MTTHEPVHEGTVEEAMDAVTETDGHADESAYTPPAGMQAELTAAVLDDPDVRREVRRAQEADRGTESAAGVVTNELSEASRHAQ